MGESSGRGPHWKVLMEGGGIAIVVFVVTRLAIQLIWPGSWADPMAELAHVVLFLALSIPLLYVVGRTKRQLQASMASYYSLAHYDELTSLPNQRYLKSELEEWLMQARLAQERLAVFFLDLDRFKNINDTMGHLVGDQVLQEVGRRFRAGLGEEVFVARMGGDEFVMLMRDVWSEEQPLSAGRTLVRLLEEPVYVDGQGLRMTTSVGIALYPEHGDSGEELMRCADVAMYRAKEKGKNRVMLYKASMSSAPHDMESELYFALGRGEFELYYQPQLNFATGQLIGLEALIRWHHPRLGLLGPGAFLPVAEESGLIVQIGEWALREACRQNKRWQDEGHPVTPVSVNLSPGQMHASNIVGVVYEVLEETGLEPRYLHLEVTESVVLQHIERVKIKLGDLRNLGIQVSLDDFGTGYSSLSYLKELPVSAIKIDKSFIQDIITGTRDGVIVSAIIAMAQSMDVGVIAEGVETAEQAAALRERGCDLVQGYYISRPQPAPEIERLYYGTAARTAAPAAVVTD
ncbi:bifunctional diguanylate cyclase/phosphodiesterase [Paenibacillus sp. IB182496]|uniref:Bifunctional diguanylate cyclase/phosphodiesterase n=1 Tax=Paenibacillus sabuli TaxID=2772509 RepID=A0A927BU82_9BACL|nr:bifunctional diguanylate cyclase/phosphodiesterase [Paenibacillus sabuli]MBD2846912.1 bifunctional diguanylate cyclase/phosphodiesterase [Paenibacillus sabuli]